MKQIIYILFLSLLAIMALVISSQNTEQVQLNFLIAQQTFALSQVISIFFFIGFILSTLAWWIIFAKSKLKNFKQQRKIDELTNENERLRIQLKDK